LLLVAARGRVHTWALAGRTGLTRRRGGSGRAAQFVARGRLVLSQSTPQTLALMDAATSQYVAQLELPAAAQGPTALRPGGLVVSKRVSAALDVAAGVLREVAAPPGAREGAPFAADVDPDGNLRASAHADATGIHVRGATLPVAAS